MSSYEITRVADETKTIINPAIKENQELILSEVEDLAKLTDIQPVDLASVDILTGSNGEALLTSLDQVDTTTNALKVINYSHVELHSGDHYIHRKHHSIAKAGVLDHLIITPNTTRWAHFTIGIEAVDSSVIAELYEDTTVSANGAVQTVRNRNRNFPDNNTTLIYAGPTVTTVGTFLSDAFLGAGKFSGGGAARDAEEILLKQNAIYLFRITEQNILATEINIIFDWYEHTNP